MQMINIPLMATHHMAIATALASEEVLALIRKNPDCYLSVSAYTDKPSIYLRSYMTNDEFDIRDIATGVNLSSYEYVLSETLYETERYRIKRVLEISQDLKEDEVVLLEKLGKVGYREPEGYLVC